MAKNYTFAEAVKIINAGTDMESIVDIGRRYPILLQKVTKVAAMAGEAFVDLMSYMPDYLTANKVNTALKNAVGGDASEEDADAAETDTESEDTEGTESESAAQWDESMSSKQLWDILGKAGKRKLAKSTKKADLIEACKQAFGNAAAPAETEDEAEDNAENAEVNPYEGKSAMELFKECKKRGIKAAPKKPASFYADLLVKADAEVAETDDKAESDDWDETETEEAPAKEEKKPAAKPAKKAPAKKAEKAETEEDDDWDI